MLFLIAQKLPKTGIVMTCNIYYIATALSLTPPKLTAA